MSDAPCGCEMEMRAERQADELHEAALREQAAVWQRRWKCPRATRQPPPDVVDLPQQAADALASVERLTGAAGLTTCPLHYARDPAVAEACKARKWAERGELRSAVGVPSAVLIDAIDLVDRSIAARHADDSARAKRAAKSKHDG